MKNALLLILSLAALPCIAQQQEGRPAYCDDIPVMYDKSAARPALPKFATAPVAEYKVQVAILKFSHPKDYPFHRSLVARYRPCEQVWVVESRESFRKRSEAEKLQQELIEMGYSGAYLIEILGYE
ncbi:hypothetical protein [Phaeodactylibacter luteus]|uniref:SPOR domain-containing protein n=1 Tax=Phaeodactylibacter luteus TaxID=1564516 RepID=A0A5C6RU67_9BACT|nr:hypothetical protein [Phaeodactylibacter luteus]TXB64892.1 hypothetical protein FRY97_06605 [Phaeodactylibacter luteus]